jgi:hypothetical protein
MCQFISKGAWVGNERLRDVHMAGCVMGFAARPWDGNTSGTESDVVKNSVSAGCTTSMYHHDKLKEELLKLQSPSASNASQDSSTTTNAQKGDAASDAKSKIP